MKKIKKFEGKEVGGVRKNSIIFGTGNNKFVIVTTRDNIIVDKFSFPKSKMKEVIKGMFDSLSESYGFNEETIKGIFSGLSLDEQKKLLRELIRVFAGLDKIKTTTDYNKAVSSVCYALNTDEVFNNYRKVLGFR